jgi:methionyl-tRNA formyltransferase
VRIVLIGQAAFAEKALEALHAHGQEIVHVFAPPEIAGARPDPLKTKALELGLPLSQPTSFRGEHEFEQIRALGADLAIMAFVTLIVPERILYAPRFKTICFHPSLLPRHRGASAINWAIIEGDAETGVTWFWPDRGIDTGPILIQRRVPIGPDCGRRCAIDAAGRGPRDLRGALPRRARGDRLQPARAGSAQSLARMRSAAGRVRDASGAAPAPLRCAARGAPQCGRAGHNRRHRSRWHADRATRRVDAGAARALRSQSEKSHARGTGRGQRNRRWR